MERDEEPKRGGYSANSYIQVLDAQIPTIYEPGMIFMQDNAPIDTTKKVKEWFENQGVMVMTWAPYSPGMNPIENVWHTMKDWTVFVGKRSDQPRLVNPIWPTRHFFS